MPVVRTIVCIIIGATLIFSVIGIAPYEQYKEAQKLDSGEVRHDVPYEAVVRQLTDSKRTADQEKVRADKTVKNYENEQRRSQHYQASYVEAASAYTAPREESG